jgi:hypothetical protein
MNKAITDGINFTPAPFSGGLDQWSSGDGTPGSATYDGAPDAAYVPSDPDFGGALELLKTTSTMKLRYMGETPIEPGCYLRIRARVKAMSGALPDVRIAGWAGDSQRQQRCGRGAGGAVGHPDGLWRGGGGERHRGHGQSRRRGHGLGQQPPTGISAST